jgi:outer membrane biosynthesis protein TonB
MRRLLSDRYPAYAASAGLHLIVLLAGVIAWPWMAPTKIMTVTPVTLVSRAEVTDLRAAEKAETVQEAAIETPVETAPPEVVTPPPPAPAKPQPTPKPVPPKPVPTKPAPAFNLDQLAASVSKAKPQKPTPAAKPAPSLDLDALAASVGKSPSSAKPSSAPKGATRAQTDLVARQAVGAGKGATVDQLAAISAKLGRLWNPNCGVEGSANVVVKIRLTLDPNGRLLRAVLVDEQRINGSGDSVLRAAATRALTAVARAAPYDELPSEDFANWRSFVVAFDARQQCRGY